MKQEIGVIGAGVMGSGVAQSFAQNGFDVYLHDVSEYQLEKARKVIAENLRFYPMLAQKKLLECRETILSRIRFVKDFPTPMDYAFVVENITEDWNVKKELYLKLNDLLSKRCILGVNTSAISITKVASLVDNPERVIGIHFMNPVPLKPIVEIIRGYHTSEETIHVTESYLKRVEKESILVNDAPGFVTNRAMMLFINEATFILQEQVASKEDIDKLFIGCFGHKMGPLQTADLIGVDTILYSLMVLYESYNDDKYRPCTLLKKMTDAGLHGMKSGKGFYEYS
jgi:3-hydroxybutyryl-CoA dehydrogenase